MPTTVKMPDVVGQALRKGLFIFVFNAAVHLALIPQETVGDFSSTRRVSLYVADSVVFTSDTNLRMTISPEGCSSSRDERTVRLSVLHEWDEEFSSDERYNLTLIDCYNFTLAYKKKAISLFVYRPTEITAYCDMSRFTFTLYGVSGVGYGRPNGNAPSTNEGKRCNFDRRGRRYPLENKTLLEMKSNPMYMVIYVLVAVFVIIIIWAICFYVGYTMLKGHRTSLIPPGIDFSMSRLSERQSEASGAASVAGDDAPVADIGLPQPVTPGASRLPDSELTVVELHHSDGRSNGEMYPKNSAPNRPSYPAPALPPKYDDIYR